VLITAQRVVAAASRRHGINIYQYLHGRSWPGRVPDELLPERNPGELVHEWDQLPGGGNHVVSFLDVVAPDEIAPVDLHQSLASLKYRLSSVMSPMAVYLDPCWIRFGTTTRVPLQIELGALAGTILLRLTGH
jgi:hypothetical protein